MSIIIPIRILSISVDSVYYKNVNLNAVDASSWFELSKINTSKPVKTVLYSTLTTTDAYQGNFVIDGSMRAFVTMNESIR